MAKIGRSISATAIACLVLLVVLLLSATRTGAAAESSVVEEKRTCLSQSHRFKGKCISDHNCRSICSGEGFPGGNCRGFRRRCFCARNC